MDVLGAAVVPEDVAGLEEAVVPGDVEVAAAIALEEAVVLVDQVQVEGLVPLVIAVEESDVAAVALEMVLFVAVVPDLVEVLPRLVLVAPG